MGCCTIPTFLAFKSACLSGLTDGDLTPATFCHPGLQSLGAGTNPPKVFVPLIPGQLPPGSKSALATPPPERSDIHQHLITVPESSHGAFHLQFLPIFLISCPPWSWQGPRPRAERGEQCLGLEFWLPTSQLIPAIQSTPVQLCLFPKHSLFCFFGSSAVSFRLFPVDLCNPSIFFPAHFHPYIYKIYTFSRGYSLSLINLTSALIRPVLALLGKQGKEQQIPSPKVSQIPSPKVSQIPSPKIPQSPLQRSPNSLCLLSMGRSFAFPRAGMLQLLAESFGITGLGSAGGAVGCPWKCRRLRGSDGQQLSHTKALREHLIPSLFSRAATPALWPGWEL